MLATDRPDAGQQSPVEYREVPERRNCDRTLAASDQLFVAPTVGTTGRVRSGQLQRPVSSRKTGFHPPTATFSVGLINTISNRSFGKSGAEETYQGC